MKTKILLIGILFLISRNVFSQTSGKSITSGKIIFDIDYPDAQLDEKVLANLPKVSTMYFKNDLVKIDAAMLAGKTTIISDNKTGEGTMLMNMMGNKWAIKINKEQMLKEKNPAGKPEIFLSADTKVIAGYKCKKAVVGFKSKDGPHSFDVWYTNELKVKNSFTSQIEGLDGFMMEFYNSQNGISMKMTARSVEVVDIADSEFKIPEGYEVKTMEELRNMNRGGK